MQNGEHRPGDVGESLQTAVRVGAAQVAGQERLRNLSETRGREHVVQDTSGPAVRGCRPRRDPVNIT